MKLHLGVEDQPYKSQQTVAKGRTPYGQGKTTFEVAKELEAKYKIMETFFEIEGDKIVEMLEESFSEAIEEVMSMKQSSSRGFSDKDTDKIETTFRQMLSSQRYDGVISGVPTVASLKGVTHSRSHPYAKKNPPRSSFIDTGMYQQSFRVWVEDVEE